MRMIFKVCLILAIFLVFFGLFIGINKDKLCGYSVNNGSHPVIECRCIGFIKNIPSKQPLSEEVFHYCYGIPKTEICLSTANSTSSKAEPYLCSDYPYSIELTENISQHPHYFHPISKFTYDAKSDTESPIVLETKEPVDCNEIKAQGYFTQVVLGDGSGKTKQDYRGYHFFAEKFICSE